MSSRSTAKLSREEVNEMLAKLNQWSLKDEAIEKSFSFKDFSEAFAFLTRTALLSEKMNHHAEYSGVYNKLSLRLSTHDAGGITQKDVDFATAVDKF